MKFTRKIIKLLFLVVVIALVGLCLVGYLFGEYMTKVGIETAATKALSVGVDIDDLDFSILKGKIAISGLVVGNPPGYAHKELLKLRSARVTAKIGSLFTDTVVIEEIRLEGITLVIEQKGLSNNLQDIIKSIHGSDQQPSKPSGKKLRIDELQISDINVQVKLLPIPGKLDTINLPLPPIRMSGLGTDNKLDTAALAKKIMVAITESIAREGAGRLPADMINTMKSTLDQTLKLGKTAVEEGVKLIDTGKDIGSGVVEGLKGLLIPKKKE